MTQNKDSNRKEQLNENLYRDHFEDMDNLKRIIYQSEQTYVKSNDQRIKSISLRTIKTAKKYLYALGILPIQYIIMVLMV